MTPYSNYCVACKGKLKLFGRRLNYNYYICCTCGTIQIFPLPNKDEIARAYASEYSKASHYNPDPEICKLSGINYYQSIIQILKDYKVTGTILDYGAGWGGLCEMLIEEGFKCQGIEMSSDMVAHCQKHGMPVEYGDICTAKGEEFSALVLCTVFEHLVEHDDWLRSANSILKRDGLFITLQPTAKFANFMGWILRLGNRNFPLPQLHQVFCPPWHTVFFSLDGMRALATKHGYKLLEIRPAPQGNEKGLIGIAQRLLTSVNRIGWYLIREKWPLHVAHTFVFKKVNNC